MARIFHPIRLNGIVVHGFGRGSKELGVPTANMDKKAVDVAKNLSTGEYCSILYFKLFGILLICLFSFINLSLAFLLINSNNNKFW